MISGFNITESEWESTPSSVRIAALSLNHQLRLFQTRFNLHQQQFEALKKEIAESERQRQAQATENERLMGEIIGFKERLGQNSSNSSLPPSSDSPFQKPANNRQPSGLKQGAQAGHEGVGRWLLGTRDVDVVVELRPDRCQRCGSGRFEPADYCFPARRQVTEITDRGTIVTEYQRQALRCSRCGKRNRAAWTPEASTGAFGSRVKAVVAYLTGRLGASQRDTVEALHELFGVKMSLGSISAAQRQISQALAEPMQEIQAHLKQQSIVYVDETGWREKARRKWLWVKNNAEATLFQIRDGRSTIDADAVIGINSQGVVTTDRYPGYNFIAPPHRQVCWAHLKRDFQAISERAGDSQTSGQGLLAQTKALFELWQRVRDGTLARVEFESGIKLVRHKVNQLLVAATTSTNSKTERTCANILKLESSLWTFTRIEGVEPTNNAAERALRRAVLWRKRSFGTQSKSGTQFVERILTVVATLRQQGKSVLEFLTAVC